MYEDMNLSKNENKKLITAEELSVFSKIKSAIFSIKFFTSFCGATDPLGTIVITNTSKTDRFSFTSEIQYSANCQVFSF